MGRVDCSILLVEYSSFKDEWVDNATLEILYQPLISCLLALVFLYLIFRPFLNLQSNPGHCRMLLMFLIIWKKIKKWYLGRHSQRIHYSSVNEYMWNHIFFVATRTWRQKWQLDTSKPFAAKFQLKNSSAFIIYFSQLWTSGINFLQEHFARKQLAEQLTRIASYDFVMFFL